MRYPIVYQQNATDCGPACLSMVAAYYGTSLSLAPLGEMAGTNGQGTSLAGLVRAARAVGFRARGVRAPPEALAAVRLPAIAHWSEAGRRHFVVLFRTGGGTVTLGDPAAGLRRLAREEFLRRWSGVLVLLEPERPIEPLPGPAGKTVEVGPTRL